MTPEGETAALAILLHDGTYARAHYAFMLAAGALAIDRPVIVFAAGRGVHALARDWSGLHDACDDRAVQARGVAGMDSLREAAIELGADLMACEAALKLRDLTPQLLLDGVRIAGIPTFLEAARGRQIITL
ncbi:DsrE/DsrF/DrsH-like family protein [Komagataeibacter sp. FNDCR2]|uniref:DsrE/DsrF/DrsH-like family protein n=1 Tax=Komagataeibacter sp. FNDCR2 TaxID=2878682 RepID=UPI001E44FD07|nr:DsrE/DsrF/DrsH-like family protein [Komagataeibacter sp. FNDCR2]MCE2575672.1 DsrE/DsrF/DrsH-like family protein [Komagataeibacter sp. FNDCR2]